MSGISRHRYGGMFGPTTGDRVRLVGTELKVWVEENLTLAGEEAIFGGGKFRLCAVRVLARDATALYRALNTFRAVARTCLDLPPTAREVR